MHLSIVSPVYKAEKIIDELVKRIKDSIPKITEDFEIILIEDGSPDESWRKIEENCKKDKRVKGIKLTRNFGQHYAITCGLDAAKGSYVVVIDCDLQDNPSDIPLLYKKAQEGYDIVYTRVKNRSHSFLRNLYSKLFSIFFNYFSETNFYNSDNSTFTLLSRKAVDAFCKIKDSHRPYLLVLHWLGFKHSFVEILHEERFEGQSSYTFLRLCELAIDGVISHSTKLLRISIVLGFVFSFVAVIFLIFILFMYFTIGLKEGWTSINCLILFTSGVILISNGVLGIYLEKTFEQARNRPLFVVDRKINLNE